jgi:molybdenum cofactor cytidylyltransferase
MAIRLWEALRLGTAPRLALVGAGGKTSVLFRLGREWINAGNQSVLLAATTHLGIEQLQLADHHFTVQDAGQVDELLEHLPHGVNLFSGPPVEAGRVSGLNVLAMDRLYRFAEAHQLPLLIEADGSRRKPLKAPGEYEPVLPHWVDQVVVVAGLSGLGQALGAEQVHRPERFSALSGISLGGPVSAEALARVLLSPQGGLKDIPPAARRCVLLNQADTPERQSVANRLSQELLDAYASVVAATLRLPQKREPQDEIEPGVMNLPDAVNPAVQDAPQGEVVAVYEKIAGIVLAAGGSTRFGRTKQTLPWHGHPLIWHVTQAALASGLLPVIVVTGSATQEVSQAVDGLPVTVVYNPDWPDGQSSSVRAGLQALPVEIGAAVFLLADQPQVPASLVRSLVEIHALTLAKIVAPQVEGRRANPVLFDRTTFVELQALSGDTGGRPLFARHRVIWVPWNMPDAAFDVDTLEDYQHLLEM